MAQTAADMNVATQMGNQAHAGEPIRRAVELVRAGIVGNVREVHVWTNRPIWPQVQGEACQQEGENPTTEGVERARLSVASVSSIARSS